MNGSRNGVKNRVLTYKINAPADLISKTLQEHGDTQDSTTRIEAAKAIKMAQAAMKRYYDRNHQAKDFEAGQEVMLRLHRGYSIPQIEVLGRKLGPQFHQSYEIERLLAKRQRKVRNTHSQSNQLLAEPDTS